MSRTIIVENCELWYCKLDPKFPNKKFSKKNPAWEIQIRTKVKEVADLWRESDLRVKRIIPEDADENPIIEDAYWRVNLRKRSIKADGDPANPVDVVDGNLDEIDARSLGNGSVGNLRIFQYEYENDDDDKGIANMLMGIQVTKHVVYKPKEQAAFGQTTTEVITPVEDPDEKENPWDSSDDESEDAKEKKPIKVGSKDDETKDF
ncbi:MAG: hypothetical protein OEX12_00210 [Gammaproteobacteria bacterium]|nr:hypothetical protein [Gammaproteobacteria bacterium]